MVWPLLENQQFSKHLNIELPYDLVILFLGTYPREKKIYIHSKACTQIFIVALFIIDKMWKKSKCPLLKITMEYYSDIKMYWDIKNGLIQESKDTCHNTDNTEIMLSKRN